MNRQIQIRNKLIDRLNHRNKHETAVSINRNKHETDRFN